LHILHKLCTHYFFNVKLYVLLNNSSLNSFSPGVRQPPDLPWRGPTALRRLTPQQAPPTLAARSGPPPPADRPAFPGSPPAPSFVRTPTLSTSASSPFGRQPRVMSQPPPPFGGPPDASSQPPPSFGVPPGWCHMPLPRLEALLRRGEAGAVYTNALIVSRDSYTTNVLILNVYIVFRV
jgi:hypothetical protein